MSNFDLDGFNQGGPDDFPGPDPELDIPIPFDDSDPDPAPKAVSRKPLTLGGAAAAKPAAKPAPQQAARAAAPRAVAAAPKPAPKAKPAARPVSSNGRITGMKTFFTKLHPGALVFLDEQVNEWLKDNPTICIKKTNVTVGEIMAKKTEPNLIMNIWY